MITSRRLSRFLWVFLFLLTLLTVARAGASGGFSEEACELSINLLRFDALVGDLDARLNLKLPSSELNEQFSPKRTYFLIDEMTITESVLPIKSSVPYSSFNNFLPTKYQIDDAGSEFYYPFDHHRAEIKVFVDRQESEGTPLPSLSRIPIHLETNLCTFEGYDVKLIPGEKNSPLLVDLIVELRRTVPIQIFSVFVTGLMLLVSAGVLLMAIRVVRSSVSPEIGVLGFCAALLFAFPAIRSSQPLVPPMGVLSDYLGFFWAEFIVAISLIILVICWIRRKIHD